MQYYNRRALYGAVKNPAYPFLRFRSQFKQPTAQRFRVRSSQVKTVFFHHLNIMQVPAEYALRK